MKDIPLTERIIFALDLSSPEQAKDWVRRLESRVHFFKVGLQLFLADWFDIVDWITARGHKVMLDLKLYDIPETVGLAVGEMRNHDIALATVHGHSAMLRAAVRASHRTGILAVTVLTSVGQEDLKDMGHAGPLADLVLKRARTALDCGCHGVVCSGLEAGRLRRALGGKFLIVTPGIRPVARPEYDAIIPKDDQKRAVTVVDAFSAGADQVVIGRPISHSKDPLALVQAMQADIQDLLSRPRP
ncbi:MAG: orotidine-5'-phosphate decarboxylase [Desulfovibrionaceae bacterium]|nr:orotidine-5'-phosphate decarboxylase [Desulfovibrionaceae bacterium]